MKLLLLVAVLSFQPGAHDWPPVPGTEAEALMTGERLLREALLGDELVDGMHRTIVGTFRFPRPTESEARFRRAFRFMGAASLKYPGPRIEALAYRVCLYRNEDPNDLGASFTVRTTVARFGDKQSYFDIGILGMATGCIPEAVEGFRGAVRLDPDWAEAHFYLCLAYEQHYVPDAAALAREHFEIAMRLEPQLIKRYEPARARLAGWRAAGTR